MKKVTILFFMAFVCFGVLQAGRRANKAPRTSMSRAVVQPTKASAISNTDAKVQAVAQALPKPGSSQWRQVMCAAKAWARMDVRDCNPEDIKAGKKIIKKVAAYVGVAVVFVVSVITMGHYGLKWRAKRRSDANWQKGYDAFKKSYVVKGSEGPIDLLYPLIDLRNIGSVHRVDFWDELKEHVKKYEYIDERQGFWDALKEHVEKYSYIKNGVEIKDPDKIKRYLKAKAQHYGVKY